MNNHYAHIVPSGKSHYVGYADAVIVWAIPANPYVAKSLGLSGPVWELSRLWAPDGHEPNLLTRAISGAVRVLLQHEKPVVLVSYADPNQGHLGGVYRAASWLYLGPTEDQRGWSAPRDIEFRGRVFKAGAFIPRRAFHSGHTFFSEATIKAAGFEKTTRGGKHRFAKPCTKEAARLLAGKAVK